MRKIATILICLLAMQGSLWAQSISNKSTAEDCLQLMEGILEGDNSSLQIYNIEGSRARQATYSIIEYLNENYLHVDWASYDGVATEEEDGSLKLTISFKNEHVYYSEMFIDKVLLSRKIYRTNSMEFTVPLIVIDRIPAFEKAAERLKQLARSNASPLLKVDIPAGRMKTMPSLDEYNRNRERFKEEIAPWDIGFLDDAGKLSLVLVEIDSEGKQKQAAVMQCDMIRTVDFDGNDLLFSASTKYRPHGEAEFETFPEFRLPLADLKSPENRSWMIQQLRYFLWSNAINLLEDGYSLGNERYAFGK